MRSVIIGKAANVLIVLVSAVVCCAQATKPSAGKMRPELSFDYSYLHSNAPPGGCGCFNLNGAGAAFAWPVAGSRFAAVFDASVTHASSVSSSGYDLTLGSYTAGMRYVPRVDSWPLQPFGQALFGIAHSSGSLVQGPYTPASNAAAAFAANFGGGVDLRTHRRIAIRLFEADYLLTTIDNGSNNHQNNLRLDAGLVLHF